MVELILPAYLLALLPEEERDSRGSRRSIWLQPGSWGALVHQIADRFPQLARRVIPDAARLANGFVLVVNDEIVRGDHASLALGGGDEVAIIAAVAGG
jgi:molybdopterin converting factor small subunit